MGSVRPMPADFREVATSGRLFSQVVAHYRAGKPTVDRWLAEAGIVIEKVAVPAPKLMPMPEGFAELAGSLSANALAERFGIGTGRATRYKRELGYEITPPPRHEIPADFASVARTMTTAAMERHYGVPAPTIRRWLARTGIAPAKQKPQSLGNMGKGTPAPMPARDDSTAGQAAEFLRRANWTVYRAQVAKPDAPKNQWVVGRLRLSTDEMIQMAQRKGWVPIYLGDVA